MAFSREQYQSFLTGLQERGYKFRTFEKSWFDKFELLLRHDVDFSVSKAREMAEIEALLGARSTYFFQVNAYFYNVFHEDVRGDIIRIKELGHEVSLHFDSDRNGMCPEDVKQCLLNEIGIFEQLFNTKIETISLHRPKKAGVPAFIGEVCKHTYQSAFTDDLAYFSDSRGVWRHGDPLEQSEYSNGDAMQILVHPIWWMNNASSNSRDILKKFLEQQKTELSKAVIGNVDFIDSF